MFHNKFEFEQCFGVTCYEQMVWMKLNLTNMTPCQKYVEVSNSCHTLPQILGQLTVNLKNLGHGNDNDLNFEPTKPKKGQVYNSEYHSSTGNVQQRHVFFDIEHIFGLYQACDNK